MGLRMRSPRSLTIAVAAGAMTDLGRLRRSAKPSGWRGVVGGSCLGLL